MNMDLFQILTIQEKDRFILFSICYKFTRVYEITFFFLKRQYYVTMYYVRSFAMDVIT